VKNSAGEKFFGGTVGGKQETRTPNGERLTGEKSVWQEGEKNGVRHSQKRGKTTLVGVLSFQSRTRSRGLSSKRGAHKRFEQINCPSDKAKKNLDAKSWVNSKTTDRAQ